MFQQFLALATKFRNAVEFAHSKGLFDFDDSLDDFPTGCCGIVSNLLAEYLHRKGIETIWYSSERGDWTHAWLVVKDNRVASKKTRHFTWPEHLIDVVESYGIQQPEAEVEISCYEANDFKNGIIIDVTGDQFDDCKIPVYVGYLDDFHQSFDFIEAYDYDGLNDRLLVLYKIIEEYL